MKDDYLWDRTGEPDPEIQQLEKILGELRYQPRPLKIPANIPVGRQRNFFRDFGPRLAIAATIAMLVAGLGVWFALQRLQRDPDTTVVQNPKSAPVNTNPVPTKSPEGTVAVETPQPEDERIESPRRPRVNRPLLATKRSRTATAGNQELTASEREGEAAKNQLMLALRVASAKLNYAQKKTQNTNSKDLIHNQHKVG